MVVLREVPGIWLDRIDACKLGLAAIVLVLIAVMWVARTKRAQVVRPQNAGLGISGVRVRNARRYHSITVLSESTPLLMETGQEFFGPPRTRQKRSPRRVATEPTSLMHVLHVAAAPPAC
ncbi:hypothetical protein GGH12_003128 [Coemansia sp. RSA 1822]|nr:hypothetical protein LPJ76_003024 [Coemansia sp. RSA 638]KAJ2126005.1 hypothetical protein IW147_000477 [Coemansia sp. RSA 720]KAJ2545829.1 hypothetical protein GGF49_000032 [Coemansia sp. RSA 1853]KAJ2562602.1 hypothetical protein GGH12_003128 [Coemansia sp. RSA 1822]